MSKKNDTPRRPRVALWATLSVVALVVVGLAAYGTWVAFGSTQAINIALKVDTNKIEGKNPDAQYFTSDFDSVEEVEANGRRVAEQVADEGVVLLKNKDNTLPLSAGEKISTFSHSSTDIATCGTGSADIDTSKAPTLRAALEGVGFEVNPTLWDFYATGAGSQYPSKPSKGMDGLTEGRASYHVNEVPASAYTDDVKSSFEAYGDVALVTIKRVSGELFDMPADGFVDGTDSLDLTQEERDLLAMVKGAGFKKVVVLINSTNAFDCSFLEDYDVDAALWIGYTGTWGLNSVANILAGNINPSGGLVDTYTYDNSSAPAMADFYTNQWANADPADTETWYALGLDGNQYYNVYQEGIYVGYRYYETRYEDAVMGTAGVGSYDYGATVAYPFGFGLSYTDFAWSDYSVAYDAASDSFTASVTVTNTGERAGKDVVQLYFQSPYTAYDQQMGIEKAAVELCGFAKTKLLEPGESQTVTVTLGRDELIAYDAKGAGTYILDAGTYYLTAANNAHEATNNVLAAKGYTTADGMDAEGTAALVATYENPELDTTTFSASAATGAAITNQFGSAEMANYGTEITYLSRSDWEGTWPTSMAGLTATDEMLAEINTFRTHQPTGEGEMPTMGADNGLTLAMMIGKDFDDPQWEPLLDQLTFAEMATLVGQGYHNTALVPSVSKPATVDDNGPQGFTQTLTGISVSRTAYTDANVMAATYNVELINELGQALGEDMLSLGANGLYGPNMNNHRTAYAGRNFEYYSEDPFLSGAMAAAEVKGIQSKGAYCYIKHFALNDSETNCRCISEWCNEQAIREIYLEPFEMAVVDGGAHNVMNSFARIGTTWTGSHEGLMTNVLRGEWGMDGFAITDFSGNSAFSALGVLLRSFDVAHGVLAGTDMWDSSATQWTDDLNNLYRDDPAIANALRESSHRILYTVANSSSMNGLDENTRITSPIPWWQVALPVADAVLVAGLGFCVFKLVRGIKLKKQLDGGEPTFRA